MKAGTLPAGSTVAVVAHGWVGDTIVCSAAAASLAIEKGYKVDFYMKWPQLTGIFAADSRFRTIVYRDNFWGRLQLTWRLQGYLLVVREPEVWSYKEPKTTEFRRIAGCELRSEYELRIPELPQDNSVRVGQADKPKITISRDLYKKAYGRNVDEFIEELSRYFDIQWVGLDSGQNSKFGNRTDLLWTAYSMKASVSYIGPEGGLLWLAAGLGVKTIYFTEHFHHVHPTDSSGDPWVALGSVNMFTEGTHVALPSFCSNSEAIQIIKNSLLRQDKNDLSKI
jgi:hypothetical protein